MTTTTRVIEHDVITTTETESEQEESARKGQRKSLFAALACGVLLAAGGYFAYDHFVASRHVETDNAYVGANTAQVTPLVGGPVRDVLVDDTQRVKRGDVLVRLDDTDAKLAYARAQAQFATARRKVEGLMATDRGLAAQIASRTADQMRAKAQLVAARSDLDKAKIDLQRREALMSSGSVSGDELTIARNALATAQANLAAARATDAQMSANRDTAIGDRDASQALIARTTVETNPEVLAARAELDQARVNLERTVIRAPVDGIVSRRQVQVGQRVQPGQTLMVVVPLQAAYVDANFKEVQLAKVRPGQTVTLVSDLYGDAVRYKGRVVGFSGGTGAAFAVVPAQNATGNWIKVVQRLPVRIALDPKQLAEHPLQVGLSMTADIDLSN
ncbi:efflux RND transporter periplasmic adaptor subunit [Novosphingobium sp. 1949]|uniref:Efflux RND transporter periplasmic adaptor subunit n=1 Tax=Novosphingobium organovorum TaxID=2930092 RepID=A0ABT0BH46_9SPHN|nr:HlyD family efflux transporter periplasmic adaptor subunit [Novosphingobium organovorum]MCJ2184392.1 efflux RND transporter periplasmic adaptor subunit [Novosphingobium organovorum]